MSVTLLVPTLDEAKALPALIERFAALDPAPDEILLVDGGSGDETVRLAREAGWQVLETAQGRALQINGGVEEAHGELVCVIHADTLPPRDTVAVIEEVMSDRKTALASFTPVIRGSERIRWGTTIHNWAKTWYAPLITRPHLFLRGVRLLFGDHAMFFRRADFLAIGGCTPGDAVMEEADLCVKFARLGRVRMVPRRVYTSDRRIAEWGPVKANWIYFRVGMLWAFGLRGRMAKHYPNVR